MFNFQRKLCNNFRLSLIFWIVKIYAAYANIIEKLIICFIVWPRLSGEFCIESLEVCHFARFDLEMIRFHSFMDRNVSLVGLKTQK